MRNICKHAFDYTDCHPREFGDLDQSNKASNKLLPITILSPQEYITNPWLKSIGFENKPGSIALIPGKSQEVESVVFIASESFWDFAKLVDVLPEGIYEIEDPSNLLDVKLSYMVWGLAHYRYDRFKQKEAPKARLKALPDMSELESIINSSCFIRDLVNTPCEQLGPEEFQAAMADLAKTHNAELTGVVGDDLLTKNFPAVHAVGRASHRAPRLLHLTWGDPSHKTICLVGKGVCFDTGGLHIKPGLSMNLMKKDMGGAAHVLGLANLIMSQKLPIHLHVITPVVENSISGNSFRPGDVVDTRKGLTVEITCTDAEGRMILSDALVLASELKPELIIDFATLTGAARVATGPEMPAYFTDNKQLVDGLESAMAKTNEALWRLPLHEGYREYLNSDIADMVNWNSSGYAGATVAGLFLKSFVDKNIPWMHIDLMSWNTKSKSGRPVGGEAQGLRAVFELIRESM